MGGRGRGREKGEEEKAGEGCGERRKVREEGEKQKLKSAATNEYPHSQSQQSLHPFPSHLQASSEARAINGGYDWFTAVF